MSIAMPVQCGICISSSDEAPCLITLNVCDKGGDGIAASFDIPFVTQENFVLNRFEANAYGPNLHVPIISEASLKGLEKPPKA